MPPLGRIRLSPFCAVIGQDRETVRTAIRTGRFPVREWEGEGQRTFDGRDAFAFELFLALTGDGAAQERAAEAVTLSRAPEDFLAALEAGEGARDLCLVVDVHARRHPLAGFQEVPGAFTCPAAEIGTFIAERIEPRPPFRSTGADPVPLGLRRVVVVPLWPAWKLAQGRAEAAGYRLAGHLLLPLTAENGDADA